MGGFPMEMKQGAASTFEPLQATKSLRLLTIQFLRFRAVETRPSYQNQELNLDPSGWDGLSLCIERDIQLYTYTPPLHEQWLKFRVV